MSGPSLPAALSPVQRQPSQTVRAPGFGFTFVSPRDRDAAARPLVPRPGTPLGVVQACRQSVIDAARPFGVVHVDAASAGETRVVGSEVVAPIEVRIIFARSGGHELRQSQVECRLGANGAVLGLS